MIGHTEGHSLNLIGKVQKFVELLNSTISQPSTRQNGLASKDFCKERQTLQIFLQTVKLLLLCKISRKSSKNNKVTVKLLILIQGIEFILINLV